MHGPPPEGPDASSHPIAKNARNPLSILEDRAIVTGADRDSDDGSRSGLNILLVSNGLPPESVGGVEQHVGIHVDYGFEKLDLNRIHACHFTGNEQSGRVLQKVGMKLEGTMRQHTLKWGVMEDLVIYGTVGSEHDHSAGTSSKGM